MSRDSYRAGKSSILSVLDAERTFLTAREREADALEQAAAVVPTLERTVGLPMPQLLQTLDELHRAPATQPKPQRETSGDHS